MKSHFHDLVFSFDLLLWIFFLSTPQTFSCHHLTASKFFPSQGTDNYISIQQDKLSTAAPVFKNIIALVLILAGLVHCQLLLNGIVMFYHVPKYWVMCYFKVGGSWSRFMFLYAHRYSRLEWQAGQTTALQSSTPTCISWMLKAVGWDFFFFLV